MTTKNATTLTQTIAQQLQKRREGYVKTLEALPMPKSGVGDFPYANMDQAVKDGFKKLHDGSKDKTAADIAFAFLVKGYKTAGWRKAAEKNRSVRDAAAEGEITARTATRVAKKVEAIKAEAEAPVAAQA